MPQDLIEGRYIKGPSYFKHFLIGTIGSDSARARLSGASRYIFTIATGYESRKYTVDVLRNSYQDYVGAVQFPANTFSNDQAIA